MKRRFSTVIVVALFVLSACAQGPVPEDSYYRLNLDGTPAAALPNTLEGVLEVARFSADGLVAGRAIVYSEDDKPHRVMEYDYHFWAEPPPVMLRDLLVAYLRGAGVAHQVVTPEMRITPQFELGGKINRFEKAYGPAPRVIIALDVALRRTRDDRLLFVKTYDAEAPVSDNTVGAAVDTLNKAMVELFAEIAADLGRM